MRDERCHITLGAMTDTLTPRPRVRAAFPFVAACVVALQVAGCVQHPSTSPGPPASRERASFSVAETTGSGTDCEFTLHLDGTAYPRSDGLELEIPHASIATTRVNNKRLDILSMQIGAGGRPAPAGRMVVMRGQTPRVVLTPTVDSAGPQLTTWQLSDTLRLLMSWRRPAAPQWLYFTMGYTTVSYAGDVKSCGGFLHSDSLRFVGGMPTH